MTSPPYFGLRDYGTDTQIGAEPTPSEFIDALIDATREMVRVLKPTGSIFVNLGDKYGRGTRTTVSGTASKQGYADPGYVVPTGSSKSLLMLPERYRIRAVDELGLLARSVILWEKVNGLPESVTDRVRRSHEDWVHLVKQPRYFSAVDELRVPYDGDRAMSRRMKHPGAGRRDQRAAWEQANPLGRMPGSVWSIPSQPLHVPEHVGVDHYAAFPMEWPRRLITGWCPAEVCTVCGDGRRPVTAATGETQRQRLAREGATERAHSTGSQGLDFRGGHTTWRQHTITGYTCSCPDTTAPATPGVCLDPFGGTGTTALVAHMLGRRGISVDLSVDYQRIAQWRCSDPRERARAAGLTPEQVSQVPAGRADQDALFDLAGTGAS